MLGPLPIIPLAFGSSRIDQAPTLLQMRIGVFTFPAALILAGIICYSAVGSPYIGELAWGWVVVSLLSALWAVIRFFSRAVHVIDELCIDIGLLYLPVGAWWLYAALNNMEPLGFGEPIVSLTAAHFHFAGLAVSVMSGMIGIPMG